MTTRVTENRQEVQTQTESKIRTEEIRERTEGLTSESLPLSFPVAKVQKETRSRAWVPQLERSTLVRGGKGLNLILTPGDAMCLSPVEGPSGWGQQPRHDSSESLDSSTSEARRHFGFGLGLPLSLATTHPHWTVSWEMAILMSQTLPALGVAVFSGPSSGSSGVVWWMRTQKSGFSCLSPPLAHRQPGAIWNVCLPGCGQAVYLFLLSPSLTLPHLSPSFWC